MFLRFSFFKKSFGWLLLIIGIYILIKEILL
jgi:hypothetical protein